MHATAPRTETRFFNDPLTGRPLRQLTDFRGHSHHLYFTNPGWWDEGRRLLFGSDRMGRRNLFSVELESGEIAQHTDADMPGPPRESTFLDTSVNPHRAECYFWRERELIALDLWTNRETTLLRCPDGFNPSNHNVTADGKTICFAVLEDLTDRIGMALLQGYVGFAEYWEAKPLSRLMQIDLEGGKADILQEGRSWYGHINTSPTQPHLFSYCHEGPWDRVDHRIWVFDRKTGRSRPVAERENPGQMRGHEYWLADGLRLGYHGYDRQRDAWLIGSVRHDGTGRDDFFPTVSTGHTHSLDFDVVVGDGETGKDVPALRIWGREADGTFGKPRLLCRHDCTSRIQQMHVHPRFSPDGTKILFTSDRTTYGQVYEVEVGDWRELPLFEDVFPKN